jgi:hypothetical protein
LHLDTFDSFLGALIKMSVLKPKVLVPAIATVVVVGGAAAYFFLKGGPVEQAGPIASAQVVPDEAMMATFISSDSKAWDQLQQFGTPEAQQAVTQSLQGFQSSLFAGSNLNYEQDLKPWVGSVMIAMMPSAKGQTQSDGTLLVVGIKDKAKALGFTNKLKGQPGVTTKETDYKGVKIAETTQPNQAKGVIYSAVLGDRLVLAPEKATIEQAIETSKGAPSFANQAGAKQLLAQSVDVKNPIAQVYWPNYGASLKQLIADSPNAAQISAENLKQLDQVESLVMALGVDDQGLRLKANVKAQPQALNSAYKPVPGKVVAQFPTATLALVSGQGLKTAWTTLVEQSADTPQTQEFVNLVRQQLKTVNLDADKDVFGWMDGEFALGAIASDQGILAPVGFGGALVMQTSDRAAAEAALSKLDAIAQKNFLTVSQRTVQGKTVQEWKLPQQEVILGHGWLDQDSLFVAIGSPVVETMVNPGNQHLSASGAFKGVTDSLPKPNAGYFYLDMDQTMTVVNNSLLKAQTSAVPAETMSVLNSVRGIGLTVTQPNQTTAQLEMLLALKPKAVSQK